MLIEREDVKYIIVILTVSVFLICSYFEGVKEEKQYLRKQYCGRVNDICYFDGNRGRPSYLVGNQWVLFSPQAPFIGNIQIGDSLLKRENSDTIYFFKNVGANSWLKYSYN